MDVRLLKVGIREGLGGRRWVVPGYGNAARIVPAHRSKFDVMAAFWPCLDPRNGAEYVRGARLDGHKSVVKNEVRRLLTSLAEGH